MHSRHGGDGVPVGRSAWKAPATQALIHQIASFLLVLGIGALLPLPVLIAALLQGLLAAAMAQWRKLAPWWLPIQFLFPVAAVLLQSVALPPWLFLFGFLGMLALYWSSFRTQVPFYPSGFAVRSAVASLLRDDPAMRFIDIGSGLGGLVLHLANAYPNGRFSGIEIAPLPWLISRCRARLARNGASFLFGDYERMNFADYDVVFAYLSPAAMPSLWRKATAEMRPGSLLLSYEFPVPGVSSSILFQFEECAPPLYGWRF